MNKIEFSIKQNKNNTLHIGVRRYSGEFNETYSFVEADLEIPEKDEILISLNEKINSILNDKTSS